VTKLITTTGRHDKIEKKNIRNEKDSKSPSHHETAALLKLLTNGQAASLESGSVDEATSSGRHGEVTREGERPRYEEDSETPISSDGIHADVVQERADDPQGEKAARLSKPANNTREPNELGAFAVEGFV
jgi:hypothetical protein